MARYPSSTKHRRDRDGVKVVGTRGPVGWLLVPALALLAVAGWVVVRATREDGPSRAPARPEPLALSDAAAPAPAPHVSEPRPSEQPAPRTRERGPHVRRRPDRPPDRPDDRAKEDEPTYTLNKPGEHAGIAAFPPPGTKPIKRGIIVPDDFELPEGYVRHYQTTDDGRRLPPVLMFHPDYEGVDAQGNPVALPEDRIVPPDMAPPGLPIRTLDQPEQAGSSTRAR